jgi:hypothetical protein
MPNTFTHNNHLKFGWGNGLYNFNDKDKQFWFKLGSSEYIPDCYKKECIRTAKLIGEAATTPILLGLSGGVDSEAVALSFLEAEVPFEVVTANIIFNGKTVNLHDTVYAVSFASKYNIKLHLVDIDFNELLENFNQIKNTAVPSEPYYKVFLSFFLHIKMFEDYCYDYYCVTGTGEPLLTPYRQYNSLEPFRYGLYAGRNFCTSSIVLYEMAYRKSVEATRFYSYTPEMMLAWLLDPDISHWIRYEKALMGPHGWMNGHAVKSFVFYKKWPDMEIRAKETGFEKITEYDDLRNQNWNYCFNDKSLQKSSVEDILSMLLPK